MTVRYCSNCQKRIIYKGGKAPFVVHCKDCRIIKGTYYGRM